MENAQTLAHEILELGADYLVRLPVVLVWVVGMLLCAVLWRRNPRGMPLAILAMAGLLVLTLVLTAVYWLLYTQAREEDSPLADSYDFWSRAASFVEYAGNALAWILVLIAVFARRPESQPAPPPAPSVLPADDQPPTAYREHRPHGPLPS
jgi:hypothetical protein